jgi:HEAT repeat protein
MSGLAELLVSLATAAGRGLRGLLVALGAVPRTSARQVAFWREAAASAGLTAVDLSDDGSLSGRVGRLRVRLSRYGSAHVYGTRLSISGPGLSPDVTVQPEGLGGSGRVAREIEVGDPEFDRAAWVEGPPALVRSLLDGDTRRALRSLFGERLVRPRLAPFWAEGRLDEGVLRVDVPEVTPPSTTDLGGALQLIPEDDRLAGAADAYVGGLARLPDVLRLVVALARRLEAPEDVPRRLADNLRSEPVAGVRLQCLTTLAREFPSHPATREALLAAREDPDAEVRLRAGIALGAEGRELLLAIAGGEGAPDETTARAVRELGARVSGEEATSLLRNALRTRRLATAKECIVALGRGGGRKAVDALSRVLAVEAGELAWAAARGLAMTRDPAAEAPLLRALSSGARDVRLAAATALGHVGTAAAVGPLREAEAGDSGMRRAARQAVAEIQARLAGAEPGQLSLASGESGQLSLAADEPGRLSFADPPETADKE